MAVLVFPYSPSAAFTVSEEMSTLHLSWTQVSHHRPTLQIKLMTVRGSLLSLAKPLPAHPVLPLSLCRALSEHPPPWSASLNPPPSQTPPQRHLPSSMKPAPAHLQSLTMCSLTQKLLHTCASYLSYYLWVEEYMLEREEVLESAIYVACLVWMSYLTSLYGGM